MEAVRYFDSGDGNGTIVYIIPVIGQRTSGMVEQIDAVIKKQTGMDVKVLPTCTAQVVERDGEPVVTAEKKKEPVKEEKKELPEAEAPAHTAEEQAEKQAEEHDGFLDLPCDPSPFARRKELIQMLKEKLEEENRLADNLEGEIEKDPIEAYKKYSKMIRDGKFGDEHVIEKVVRRLTILYRAEVLTTDINNLAEFFEVFETQLLHEMSGYRAYCERSGETQSRKGLMGFLARKYWDDQNAQAEAKRLMDNEIPDVARLLMGQDMTSGLPFID